MSNAFNIKEILNNFIDNLKNWFLDKISYDPEKLI